jgi:hypothetical protein
MDILELPVTPVIARSRADARIRDLTVRRVLAQQCAARLAQEWGHDDEARTWAQKATRIEAELAPLVQLRDAHAEVLLAA